ncbi:hypothetical protein DFH08DRAFT_815759 [Mycena albidolilacea]|uniref:Uncharacterized protein n=1 Tax=Mycena albidolilacea TaxID=1033008 RepID=A0AAD7EID6_9AGAR|nr:hypothetical protein DFH08DRAFT_815759 [Mycena albidolilacea]
MVEFNPCGCANHLRHIWLEIARCTSFFFAYNDDERQRRRRRARRGDLFRRRRYDTRRHLGAESRTRARRRAWRESGAESAEESRRRARAAGAPAARSGSLAAGAHARRGGRRDGFTVEDDPLVRYDDPASTRRRRYWKSGRASALMCRDADKGAERQCSESGACSRPQQRELQPALRGRHHAADDEHPGSARGWHELRPSHLHFHLIILSYALVLAAPTHRLIARMNLTHTVGDLRGLIDATSTSSSPAPAPPAAPTPSAPPSPRACSTGRCTVKEAGLGGMVVVQSWEVVMGGRRDLERGNGSGREGMGRPSARPRLRCALTMRVRRRRRCEEPKVPPRTKSRKSGHPTVQKPSPHSNGSSAVRSMAARQESLVPCLAASDRAHQQPSWGNKHVGTGHCVEETDERMKRCGRCKAARYRDQQRVKIKSRLLDTAASRGHNIPLFIFMINLQRELLFLGSRRRSSRYYRPTNELAFVVQQNGITIDFGNFMAAFIQEIWYIPPPATDVLILVSNWFSHLD